MPEQIKTHVPRVCCILNSSEITVSDYTESLQEEHTFRNSSQTLVFQLFQEFDTFLIICIIWFCLMQSIFALCANLQYHQPGLSSDKTEVIK